MDQSGQLYFRNKRDQSGPFWFLYEGSSVDFDMNRPCYDKDNDNDDDNYDSDHDHDNNDNDDNDNDDNDHDHDNDNDEDRDDENISLKIDELLDQ